MSQPGNPEVPVTLLKTERIRTNVQTLMKVGTVLVNDVVDQDRIRDIGAQRCSKGGTVDIRMDASRGRHRGVEVGVRERQQGCRGAVVVRDRVVDNRHIGRILQGNPAAGLGRDVVVNDVVENSNFIRRGIQPCCIEPIDANTATKARTGQIALDQVGIDDDGTGAVTDVADINTGSIAIYIGGEVEALVQGDDVSLDCPLSLLPT